MAKKSTKLSTTPSQNPTVITNKFMTYSTPFILFILVLDVIAIVINSMTLMWLHKLEDISCKCSDNWMRSYIKYFLYAYFVMLVISFVVNAYLFLSETAYKESQVYSVFRNAMIVFNAFSFINIIIAIIYIDDLKKQNCTCSEDIRGEIYWYYSIIKLALFGLMLMTVIILMLILKGIMAK